MNDIRLVNGDTERDGTIQICLYGYWGFIDATGWDDTDTKVVCAELGFLTFSKC